MKELKTQNLVASGLIIFYLLTFTGCATVPYAPTRATIQAPGFYHKVERGESLWRISKIYNVNLNEIVKINRISDGGNIETGQLIFIPTEKKQAFTSYKSSRSGEDFIWPIKGKVITYFGQTFNNMVNKGLNIQPYKTENVVAVSSGKVIFYTDNLEGFGKTIIIDHGNGFSSVYARNAHTFVKVGEFVQKGALIAKAGSTDRDKNTYLHFQLRKGYVAQNPYFYLPH